jgi:hypothetical protein
MKETFCTNKQTEKELNIQSKDILYIMSIPIRKNNALTTTNRNNTFETLRRITNEKTRFVDNVLLAHQEEIAQNEMS